MDQEAEEAVLELEDNCGKVAASVRRCAELVNEGRLDGGVVMAKITEVSTVLMGGGQQ